MQRADMREAQVFGVNEMAAANRRAREFNIYHDVRVVRTQEAEALVVGPIHKEMGYERLLIFEVHIKYRRFGTDEFSDFRVPMRARLQIARHADQKVPG